MSELQAGREFPQVVGTPDPGGVVLVWRYGRLVEVSFLRDVKDWLVESQEATADAAEGK